MPKIGKVDLPNVKREKNLMNINENSMSDEEKNEESKMVKTLKNSPLVPKKKSDGNIKVESPTLSPESPIDKLEVFEC